MNSVMRWFHRLGPQGPGGLSLFGLLLTPTAFSALALATWRFGVDAGWTGAFFIAHGFLSHWQVWLAFAIGAEVCGFMLSLVSARELRATS
jgi:hypothetical protein